MLEFPPIHIEGRSGPMFTYSNPFSQTFCLFIIIIIFFSSDSRNYVRFQTNGFYAI